jgi:hypothetical protein
MDDNIKIQLDKECQCYVLITCSKPNENGGMNVEMSYEGDETLAAFLVENAAQVFENNYRQREIK